MKLYADNAKQAQGESIVPSAGAFTCDFVISATLCDIS